MKFSTVISIVFVLSAQNYCGINVVLGDEQKEILNTLFRCMYEHTHGTYCTTQETVRQCLENNITDFLGSAYISTKPDGYRVYYAGCIDTAINSFRNSGEIINLLTQFKGNVNNMELGVPESEAYPS